MPIRKPITDAHLKMWDRMNYLGPITTQIVCADCGNDRWDPTPAGDKVICRACGGDQH